jgi:hypothetical protein
MMKILAIAGVVIVAAVLVVLGLALMKPNDFRVERAITIKAPPDKIVPLIENFHAWTAWSPWEKRDPNLKRTYGGPPKGKGATYAWEGNKNVGSGAMEVLESGPQKVRIKLDFLKPFEGHNTAEFTLVPAGDTTNLTWAMYGPNVFMGKVMQVFMDMDKMIGKDFEAGLADMKAAAEK